MLMQIPTLSNLGSIFETNDSFEIPRFQRPYEWSEKDQISDLWADICSSARSGRDHFIGSLIIMPLSDTTKFMLIDGQQRLITLTILIRVLKDIVQSEGNMNWPNLCSDALYIRNYSRRRVDRVASDKGKYNARCQKSFCTYSTGNGFNETKPKLHQIPYSSRNLCPSKGYNCITISEYRSKMQA